MRAARVSAAASVPVVGDVEDPSPDDRARVVAAGLNPVDLAIVSGSMPFRRLADGAVAGFEGVAEKGSGELVYISAPRSPYGSFAELVPLAGAETTPVPAGLEPVAAAALGVPGIAAWMALTTAGELREDDRVLILGGTGSVGRIALQAAQALGASTVVGTARDDAGSATIEDLGGVAVSLAAPDSYEDALRRISPDGFDLVIDTLWGDPLSATLRHLRTGGRVAQIGNAAGARADVAAADFRNRRARIVGHSNFLASSAERTQAYAQVAQLAAEGRITVQASTTPLSELPSIWERFAVGDLPGKTVVVP